MCLRKLHQKGRANKHEKETKKLHEESKKYFNAINGRPSLENRYIEKWGSRRTRLGMLTHQIEFSRAIAEVYKPISGRVSDPDSFVAEGNDAGIEACDQYEAVVRDLQETLAPELEMIEQRVIAPADELLQVIRAVRKTTGKRAHKQLDYDRKRDTLKKLQDKKDKTLKDEKALYKAESEAEQATQDFEYFNNLLKDELPKLFRLEREFIRPLFQSFYYMQLNVFYTLHEKTQGVDIGYFDLSLDVEAAFSKKRGDVQEQAEALEHLPWLLSVKVSRIVDWTIPFGVVAHRGACFVKFAAGAYVLLKRASSCSPMTQLSLRFQGRLRCSREDRGSRCTSGRDFGN